MKLNERDLATILAALRYWRGHIRMDDRKKYPYFDDECEPLDDFEIDVLCEELNVESETLNLIRLY